MSSLKELMADVCEEEVLSSVEEKLSGGEDPGRILGELREGMDLVGSRFEAKEYYLSELILAGMIFKSAMVLLEPHLSARQAGENLGKVVLGTAKGDVHDIGKNIVAVMLKGSGFEVIDLGTDVPPERFVGAVRETGATIVGISGLLTTAFDSMKRTVEALEKAGLRDGLTVALGGAPVNEDVRKFAGADAVGKDAMEAVEICRKAARAGQRARG